MPPSSPHTRRVFVFRLSSKVSLIKKKLIVLVTMYGLANPCASLAVSVLTKKYLVEGDWATSSPMDASFVPLFKANGTFTTERAVEGCQPNLRGTYKITGKHTLTLKITAVNDCAEEGLARSKLLCQLRPIKNSLEFTTILTCNNYINAVNRKHRVPDGAKRLIEKHQVIVFKKKGRLTDRAMLRSGPGKQFLAHDKLKLIQGEVEGHQEWLKPYLPKGHRINILARTENKKRVGEHSDYWYFLDHICDNWYSECPTNVWVFGKYILVE